MKLKGCIISAVVAGALFAGALFAGELFAGAKQPIIEKHLADPFIYESGGIYYLIATGNAEDGRKLPIYKSTNLESWEFVRGAVEPGPEELWNRYNFWAPEVIELDGKFYCYYTAAGIKTDNNRDNRVGAAVSDSPAGPFENCGIVIPHASLDGSPFLDDDGQLYLYYTVENGAANGWQRGQIRCVRMSDPLTPDGEHVPVITHLSWTEGATGLKIDGQYFLMYSTGGWDCPNYQVRAAGRSTSPFGPFVEQVNPILKQNDELKGPGHNCWFRGPAGELRTAYHAWDNKFTDRYPFISRLGVGDNKELFTKD